jgi:hypothetical protein
VGTIILLSRHWHFCSTSTSTLFADQRALIAMLTYQHCEVSGRHYGPGHQVTGALGGPHERGIKYESDVLLVARSGPGNDIDYRPRPVLPTLCQYVHRIRKLRRCPQAMLDSWCATGVVCMFTVVSQATALLDTDLM